MGKVPIQGIIKRFSAYSVYNFPGRDDLVYVAIAYTDTDGTNPNSITLLFQKEELAEECPRVLESIQEE